MRYFKSIPLTDYIFLQDTLNDFIEDSRKTWRAVRNRIAELFDVNYNLLKSNEKDKKAVIFNMDEIKMQLPIQIEDYTDFYDSKEQATNVGTIYRERILPLQCPLGLST